jgi:hypothetical protein
MFVSLTGSVSAQWSTISIKPFRLKSTWKRSRRTDRLIIAHTSFLFFDLDTTEVIIKTELHTR